MKFDKQDLKRLQWSIVLLVLLVAIGAGSVWGTTYLLGRAQKEQQATNAKRADIQSRLSRARDEEQELREKITRYQQLEARGYVGPEKRLDWLEAIAAIKTAHRIQSLDYEFSPQRPADTTLLPAGANPGAHDVMASAMRLRMPLLHEGDLLNFIADLKNKVQALIVVRSCGIERTKPSSERSGTGQLAADCTLEWITLKERK